MASKARSVNCLGHVFTIFNWGGADCAGEKVKDPDRTNIESLLTPEHNKQKQGTARHGNQEPPRPRSQVHGPRSNNTEQENSYHSRVYKSHSIKQKIHVCTAK